jgi:long-chain acyl-CoA synthetase
MLNAATMLTSCCERYADREWLRHHRDGGWRSVTYRELYTEASRIAGGLRRIGLQPGDRVVIMAENRLEWSLADFGAILAGCVPVGIYAGVIDAEALYVTAHASARVAFVENATQASKLTGTGRPECLDAIVVMDGDVDGLTSWHAFAELASEDDVSAALAAGREVDAEAMGIIIYTSGTTANPKGAVLTHRNIVDTVGVARQEFGAFIKENTYLRALPLAHALERCVTEFYATSVGGTILQIRGLDTLVEDLRELQPAIVALVPRFYEKFFAGILARAEASGAIGRWLFRWATRAATRASVLEEAGQDLPPSLELQRRLARLLVFRRIHEALGGRVSLLLSGGAPLSAEVARFFHGAGLLICECWGMTESSALGTANTPAAYRLGTVGRAVAGVEVRVAEDGELLMRGRNVFREYFRDPEATSEALDADGFLHTGDVGTIDADGFISITDRKKELIITSGGKNIAPQKLENMLREQPGISNAMVYCDRRPYVVALVTLDRVALVAADPQLHGCAAGDPRVRALIEAGIERVNQRLARFERIKRFAVLEHDFSPATGELTPTMKLKRRVIAQRHASLLATLYEQGES